MTAVEKAAADLLEEVDKVKAENAYLRKENRSLWESLDELRAMNERAREDA